MEIANAAPENGAHPNYHIHMIGTAYIDKAPLCANDGNVWLKELVDLIEMQILMGPYSIACEDENNEGVTGAVVISTSHLSFHSWHMVDKPFIKFDCYSCRKFNPEIIVNHFKKFSATRIDYIMLDRNPDNDLEIIAKESLIL